MQAQIHPQYNAATPVTCSCGNSFTVGSTKDSIHVELCNNCHPFYTGKHRFVDSASRIDKFENKRKNAQPLKEKVQKGPSEPQQPRTLKEMLEALKR